MLLTLLASLVIYNAFNKNVNTISLKKKNVLFVKNFAISSTSDYCLDTTRCMLSINFSVYEIGKDTCSSQSALHD